MAASADRGVLVLTGASGGLGPALAAVASELGFEPWLVGRRREALEALAQQVHGAQVVPMDLADPAAFGALDQRLDGRCRALIHGAAAFAAYGPVGRLADAELDAVLQVNLGAALRLSRLALPGMRAAGFGRLLFLSSRAASQGAHGQAAYAAAKAGLAGLVRSLALEGGPQGVTANALELGLIDTPRVRGVLGEAGFARLASAAPAGRAGRPGEVAAFARFLLGELGAFVNGAVLPMDGGLGLGLLERGGPA